MSKRRSRAGFKEASGLKHDVHSALRAPAAFAEWEYLDLSSRGVPGRHSERDLLALTPEASNLTSTLDASRSFNKTSRSSTSGSRRSRASSNGVNGKAVVDEGSSSTSTHADVVPPSSSRVVSSAPLLASTSNGSRHRRRVSLPQELISGNGDLGSSSHKAVTKSDVQDEDEEAFLLRYLGPVAGTSLQHSHAQSTFQSSSSTSSSSPQSPVVPPSPPLANSFTAIPAAKPGSFAARALERSRLSDRGRKKFIVQQRQDAGLDGVSEAQPPLPLLSPERLPSPQSQPLPQDLPFWLRSEASDEVHADEASSHSSVGQGTSNVLRGGPQTTPASVRQQAFQQQQQQQQQFVGRVHRRGESVHAAVVLQRCWRGYLARVFVWQRNGPGAAWMATKIQAVMRGCLARAFVERRLQYRLSHAASLLQGLGRGWQGRVEAKRERVARMATAASTVQRVYRGRLGKAWFELFKKMIREARAKLLQRCYRGSRARIACAKLRQQLEDGVFFLAKCEVEYETGALQARVAALLGEEEMEGAEGKAGAAGGATARGTSATTTPVFGMQAESKNGVGNRGGEAGVIGRSKKSYLAMDITSEQEEELLRLALGAACSRSHAYAFALRVVRTLVRLAWARKRRLQLGAMQRARERNARRHRHRHRQQQEEEEGQGQQQGKERMRDQEGSNSKGDESKSEEKDVEDEDDVGDDEFLPTIEQLVNHSEQTYPSVYAAAVARQRAARQRREACQPPVRLLYAYAILCQLDWSASGTHRTMEHAQLDEALLTCERCWWAEGEEDRFGRVCAISSRGCCFEDLEQGFFRAAVTRALRRRDARTASRQGSRRRNCASKSAASRPTTTMTTNNTANQQDSLPSETTAAPAPLSPADARCLRDYAVCLHTCYGSFRRSQPVEKFKGRATGGGNKPLAAAYVEKPIPWLRSCAYRRARGLLARAINLDTLGMDHTLSMAASIFETIFASIWRPVGSETRTLLLHPRSLLEPARSCCPGDPPPGDFEALWQSPLLPSFAAATGYGISPIASPNAQKAGSPSGGSRGRSFSAEDLEPQGTARINVMLYKCGRKLILRAARVYTAPTRASTTATGGRNGSSSSSRGSSREQNNTSNLLSPKSMFNASTQGSLSLMRRGWEEDNGGGDSALASKVDKLEDYPDKGLWHDLRLDGGGYFTVLPAGKWAKNSRGVHPTWVQEGWRDYSKTWTKGRNRLVEATLPPPPPLLLLPIPSTVHERALVAGSTQRVESGEGFGQAGTTVHSMIAKQEDGRDQEQLQPFEKTFSNRQDEPGNDDYEYEREELVDLPGGGWIPNEAWEGDGRLCFVGMIIHETEVEDLTALATRFYLEVQKRPDAIVRAAAPLSLVAEFLLPRLELLPVVRASPLQPPPSPPLPPPPPPPPQEHHHHHHHAQSNHQLLSPSTRSSFDFGNNNGDSSSAGLGSPLASSSRRASQRDTPSSPPPLSPLSPASTSGRPFPASPKGAKASSPAAFEQPSSPQLARSHSKNNDSGSNAHGGHHKTIRHHVPSNLDPTPSDASLVPGRPLPFCIQAAQNATDARARRWNARMALRQSLGLPVPSISAGKKVAATNSQSLLPSLRAENSRKTATSAGDASATTTDASVATGSETARSSTKAGSPPPLPPLSVGFHESELAVAAAEEQTRIQAWKELEHKRLNFNSDAAAAGAGDESTTEPTTTKPGEGGGSIAASSSLASRGSSGANNSERVLCDPECVRWYSVQVPALAAIRLAANQVRIQNEAVCLLQKAYRGFTAKASWKRLKLRLRTKKVQREHLLARRAAAEAGRAYEKRMVSKLQSRFKGLLWRVRLAKMKLAAVVVQAMVRGYQGRRRREAIERARLEGLPVIKVFERGMNVSGTPLIVTVRRCGLSFRFTGVDLRAGATYNGYVYGPTVLRILELTQPQPPTDAEIAANPQLKRNDTTGWTTAVRPWQLDRVRDLLLSMLALTEPIGALSSDLKRLEPGRTLVVHPILGAKVTGPTTLRTFGLGRALRDQFRAARKGENWLRKEARIAAQSRGDPLAKPAAHRGRLVTVAPQDPYAWARMTPAQQKNAERHAQVDVPALRRMNRRHKPNLTRDNMSYYRPPSPTPEERRLLRKQMAKEKAAGSGMGTGGGKSGMSKEHMDKANKELDALFAE